MLTWTIDPKSNGRRWTARALEGLLVFTVEMQRRSAWSATVDGAMRHGIAKPGALFWDGPEEAQDGCEARLRELVRLVPGVTP